MKKLLTILLTVLSCAAIGQVKPTQGIGVKGNIVKALGQLASDSALLFPKDTIRLTSGDRAIAIKGNTPYIWLGSKWELIISGEDTLYVDFPLRVRVDTNFSPTHRILFILHANGLVNGGIVTKGGCMTVDVTPATYVLGFFQYTTAGITLTVPPADNTFPTAYEVVVDTFGIVSILRGTPAATPLPVSTNPSSQIVLSTFTVPAAASCLGIIQKVIYDQDSTGEFTHTQAGTQSTSYTNPDNPYHLSKAIFMVSHASGATITFTDSGLDTVQFGEIIKFWIYLNGAFTGQQIQVQYFLNGVAVSNAIVINSYFNTSDSNAYQNLSVPLSAWSFTTRNAVFNKVVITFAGDDLSGAKGFYLDYIQLQTGGNNVTITPADVYDFAKNVTRDSIILTMTDGRRIAVKDSVGSGGAGATNSNIGSGFRLVVPNTNNIKTVFNGYAIGIDSASNANALTLKADTSLLLTKLVNPSAFVADSVWFAGTSITSGVGATAGNRFPTLVSNKLGAKESNHGCAGCSMWIEGINATNIGLIPTYSATKYRWMVLEWGTNDMGLGVTDTATYAAAYLRYLDTVIARGWPASKILLLSPSYTDSSFVVASTYARQTMFVTATQAVASRRNTLYLNNYIIEKNGGSFILVAPDGIHPSDYTVSMAYVNPIVNVLGDSVRSQGQVIAVNGLSEFQKVKLKTVDTASYKSVPLGLDSAGNIVRYSRNSLIYNSNLSQQNQSASISLTGYGLFGGVTSPTAQEMLQVNGTLKGSYGRFTTGATSTVYTGSSLELGFFGNEGIINAINRTANTQLTVHLASLGGKVGVGSAPPLTGTEVFSVDGGGKFTWGQFVGGINMTTGNGVEIGRFGGSGYIGSFDRDGGAATNLFMQGLGGNVYFGSLAASGTNNYQFVGNGHFTTGLFTGGTSTPNSGLQTTSFAMAYVAKATSYTVTIADHTINVTATGQTITLPTAAGITGREYTIKLTASGSSTVASTSSQTIDASTTYSLSAQYKYVTVQSDGANWIIIANN